MPHARSLAFITGAGSGIGRALARACAARGLFVVGLEGDQTRATALEAELAGAGCCLCGDVRIVDDLAHAKTVCESFGSPISLVFANAGVLRAGRPWEQAQADRDLVVDVNVKGVLNTLHVFAPALFAQSEPSAVVFTGSLASFSAAPGLDAYAASKHAVLAIATAFAEETRTRQPHVRAVFFCPGAVRTAIADDDVEGNAARLQANIRRRAQDGADPDEVAAAALDEIAAGAEVILLDDRAAPAIAARALGLREGRLV